MKMTILYFLHVVFEKEKEEKIPPLPHSKWEEDSEESDDELKNQQDDAAGADVIKRTDNAIFRRAISAIKPKVIEIKLRPERRVLLDSSAAGEVANAGNDHHHPLDPSIELNLVRVQPVDPKMSDAVDEKKKSVRDRLGDKVDPEQRLPHKTNEPDDKLEDVSKSKHKERSSKKDKEKDRGKDKDKEKRSSPSKDKVIHVIFCAIT